jgi:hypothetical protein
MDRSFLSDDQVIEASRNFVCIRLATYEDEAEAEFLRTVYVGRTGDLENTVFVLMTPDTKENLCRPGRSPDFAFRSPSSLAAEMNKIAKQYEASQEITNPILPQLKDVRLGLNVSSCDGLPSVVCVADENNPADFMQSVLAPMAYSTELAGKFVYSTTTDSSMLESVQDYSGQPGILLIEPGEYGLDGKLIKYFSPSTKASVIEKALTKYANAAGKVTKNHSSHVRTGRKEGKVWKTEIPVEDRNSLQAMERSNRPSGRGGPGGRRPGGK